MGAAHWLVHIIAMVSLYILVNHYGYWEWLGNPTRAALEPIMGESVQMLRTVAYMVQMIVGGGFVAGIVWGLYLFFACAFFRRHWNDAFSSLRIPDYKNFLRLKIEPEKLTIFPIGLVRTPTRLEWRESGNRPGVLEPRIPLSPELIDGPVVIEPANVRHRPEQPGEVSPSGRRP